MLKHTECMVLHKHKHKQHYERYFDTVELWKCLFIKTPCSRMKDVGLEDVLPINSFHWGDDTRVVTRHCSESSENKHVTWSIYEACRRSLKHDTKRTFVLFCYNKEKVFFLFYHSSFVYLIMACCTSYQFIL